MLFDEARQIVPCVIQGNHIRSWGIVFTDSGTLTSGTLDLRVNGAAIYDAATNSMIMFGGDFYADTSNDVPSRSISTYSRQYRRLNSFAHGPVARFAVWVTGQVAERQAGVRKEVGLAVVADFEGDVDYGFEVDGDAGLQGGAEFPLAQGGFGVGV
jgi:hypothetical protein